MQQANKINCLSVAGRNYIHSLYILFFCRDMESSVNKELEEDEHSEISSVSKEERKLLKKQKKEEKIALKAKKKEAQGNVILLYMVLIILL